MEETFKAIAMLNSKESSLTLQKTIGLDKNSLSIYQEGELTKKGAAEAIAVLKAAFPSINENQLLILREAWIRNGFTDERARDSVFHVISTHIYATPPQIASFIQYDKSYLTYKEAIEIGLEHCEIADKERKLWKRK